MANPPIDLKLEEGQLLLRTASHFALPEKLGEGKAYTPSERSLASKDVQKLYLALKRRSPLLERDRRLCFGPESAWDQTGPDNWKMRQGLDMSVPFEVEDEDVRSGVYWLLLLSLHPSSPVMLTASQQVEVGWPLAQKFRLRKKLEKDIGLEGAEHKRLDLDPLPGEEEEEKEKEAPAS